MTSLTFGRYQVVDRLGSGGMADVYLAQDPVLGRQVAVKTPRLGPEARARFDVEARAVARLEHPAIVPLYEYGDSGGQPYLVMRHMRGGSLADRIARRPLSAAEAQPILARIAAALDYAHSHGVIHRDVKPGNILFDENGQAFLSDFGIARLAERDGRDGPRLTVVGAMPGSPAYLSPEQAQGARDLDSRTDIFSLGVVVYEMLTGSLPFPLGPAQAAAGAPSIVQRRPDLPAAIQPVIARALAPDRAARYGRAADLVADLHRALGGARPQSPGRTLSPWLIGGVMVMALALFWLFLRDGGDEPPAPPGTSAFAAVSPAASTAETSMVEPTDTRPSATAGQTPFTSTPLGSPVAGVSAETLNAGVSATDPDVMVLGRTSLGTPILIQRFGNGPKKIFFVGGMTGLYAPATVDLADQLSHYLSEHPEVIPDTSTIYIVPVASPDTPLAPGEYRGRLNANGVDINHNWDCEWAADSKWGGILRRGNGGPAPFSEEESRSLSNFILSENAAAVVVWHARATDGIASPGGCGDSVLVSNGLAGLYGLTAGYLVENFGDLPDQTVNGDATNWLDSVGIPAVSVILPSTTDPDWENNLPAILAVIEQYGGREVDGVLTGPDALPGEVIAGLPTELPTIAIPPSPIPLTPVPATVAPTMPAVVCQTSPGDRWGDTLWDLYAERLICALNQTHSSNAAFQYFQRGTTIWREDIDRVYVLYNDGSYASFRGDAAPQGYYDSDLLKGAFGHLWNTNQSVRDRLGQPIAAEANATDFVVQDFRGGVLIYFYENDAHNYALFNDNNMWTAIQE